MKKFVYPLLLGCWLGLTMAFGQNSQPQKSSTHQVVYFEYKKAHLDANAKTQLDRVGNDLQAVKITNYQIILTGVADSVGGTTDNYALAKKRALNVQEYLNQLGLDAQKMTIKVLGELPASNADEHHKNRRVDLHISWQTKAVKPSPPIAKITDDNMLEFFEKVKQPAQTFLIDNSRDTLLLGRQGTGLLIKANSFYLRREQQNQLITISLREYYTYADMILANLTTTSNKKMLETGGMVHLTASVNGKQLRLIRGKSIFIAFPNDAPQGNMQAFNGKRDRAGFINWRLNRRGWVSRTRGMACEKPPKICWLRRLFSGRLRRRYQKLMDRWEKATSLNDQLRAQENERRNKDSYLMSVNQLGWVNCDAFYKIPNRQIAWVKVKAVQSVRSTRFFLVLDKRRSILGGYPYNPNRQGVARNTWGFGSLPKNEAATLIVLQYQKDKVLVASQKVTTGQKITPDFDFSQHSLAGAHNAIEKITAPLAQVRKTEK